MYFLDTGEGQSQLVHFLSHIQIMVHELNAKWWHDDKGNRLERNAGELIALIHSEASEMLEGVRKNCMDDHLPHLRMEEVEAADIFIRLLDYCEGRGLNLARATIEKLKYNRTRADHSHEQRARDGGKKF